MIDNLEELLVIEKRIDERDVEDIRDRWESGKLLLTERAKPEGAKGGRPGIPKARMAELVEAIGKEQSELKYRMQFAEQNPTEESFARAVAKLGPEPSWTKVKASLPKPKPAAPKGKSRPEPKPAPKADAPILADAINALEDRGVKYTARDVVEIVAAEGVEVSVDTVERKRKAVRAERNAPPVDYDSLPGKVADKWDRVEATLRRKLEREYSTRLLAEIDQIKAQLKDDVKAYKAQIDAEAEKERESRNVERERYRTAVEAYKAKGLIPLNDWRLIQRCFHADSHGDGCLFSRDDLNAAFNIINDAKVKALLVKE